MKLLIYLSRTIVLFMGVCFISNAHALFEDKNIIWKSGYNQFVLVNFDTKKHGPNQHPVKINLEEIDAALKSLTLRGEGFSGQDEQPEPVFTFLTARRLAENIVKGLNQASPDQDLFFTVQSSKRKLMILTKKFVTSGRAFYRDDKLNIIIGDYEIALNDELERILDPGETGTSATLFGLDDAERSGQMLGGFDEDVLMVRGIEYKTVNEKRRKDWFVIDLESASEAYAAQQKELEERFKGRGEQQLEREAALLAKQRREMRAEMARMRQQIDAMEQGGSSSGSDKSSIEERMATLDALRAKDLITQDEYESKRQEILNDI
ncbi:MAG: SHOCT domain-containing protein [Gammaproteobacteria bacterium]